MIGALIRVRLRSGTSLAIIAGIVSLATVTPLGVLVYRIIVPGEQTSESGAAALQKVFTTSTYLPEIRNSLILAACSAVITTAIALLLAWLIERTNLPMGRMWETLLLSTFALPPLLAATAWVTLLAPQGGYINYWWHDLGLGGNLLNIQSLIGLIFVQSMVFVPLAYLVLTGAVASLPGDEEEAAKVHGATTWHIFRYITFPALQGAIVTAFVLVFAFALQSFPVPLVIANPAGIPTIAATMYLGFLNGSTSAAETNALGLLLLIFGLIALVCLLRVQRTQSRLSNLGRGPRRSGRIASAIDLGKARWVIIGVVSLYFLVSIVLPMGALVITSFMKYITPQFSRSIFTISNYTALYENVNGRLAIKNSLVIAVSVATIGAILSVPFGYMIARRVRGSSLATLTSVLPLSSPRLCVAFGFLYSVGLVPGLSSLPNIVLLSLAVFLTYFGIGIRIMVPPITELGTELDDAALLAGAGLFLRLWKILVPGLWPSLIAVWRTLFVLALLELDVVVFLYQSDGITLSVLALNTLSSALTTAVFPLVVVEVAMCAVVVVITAALRQILKVRMSRAPRSPQERTIAERPVDIAPRVAA